MLVYCQKNDSTSQQGTSIDLLIIMKRFQVKRLNDLMSDVISIHGRGNFPTIDVKLCDLVSVVRRKLEEDGVHVKEIRLNGSGASSVLVIDVCSNTWK